MRFPNVKQRRVRNGDEAGGEWVTGSVVGLLPFALSADGRALIVHASRLARHTAGLAEGAPFDALVHEPVTGGVDPLAGAAGHAARRSPRVRGARSPPAPSDRATYLAKFPDAEPVTALGDFAFFRLEITGGRLVSGFGGADQSERPHPALAARRQCAVVTGGRPVNERLSMSL